MSVLARRDEFRRERALIAMRDAVVAATTSYMPTAGSSATLEAVDEALAQLVATRQHVGDADEVKALWITYARRRLIDEHRSAEAKHRDAITVDEHAHALAVAAPADTGEPTDERRAHLRVREILSVLHGEQRRWAQAWYREVLSLPAGAQPRGLPDVLGWSSAKTEKTSQRARRKMAAFITERQTGVLCAEQRTLLDAFIAASAPDRGQSEALDDQRYEALVLHVAGCEDCWALWDARRRSLRARCHAIVLLPLDALSAAGHALADRLAAAAAGAHSATQALLGRLGLGGAGAGAAALGSSAATISTKTAAVCVGVVCAATAGGEIAGVLPALHERTPKTQGATAAKPKKAIAPAATQTQTSALRNATPTTPSPVRSAATLAATSRKGPQAQTATIQAPVTPGDLPVARAVRSPSTPTRSSSPTGLSTLSAPSASSTTTRPRRATSSATANEPDCVPGDLGC
jgi:DNA-directed RNA polymerase specialized sigma24 family protein